jgi:hypothetical protein
MLIQEAKRLQQLAGLSLNEEESKEENVIDDLKSQMGSLISGIEDELEDASKEQKEGLLTAAGIALALPVFKSERLGRVIPTRSDSSESFIFLFASITSRLTIIDIFLYR